MAHVLYFAGLVDTRGRAARDAALPPEVHDVRTLLAWLRARGKPWASALGDSAVRATLDEQFVSLDALVGTRRP